MKILFLLLLLAIMTSAREEIPVAVPVNEESDGVKIARMARDTTLKLAENDKILRLEDLKSRERIEVEKSKAALEELKLKEYLTTVEYYTKDGFSFSEAMTKAKDFKGKEEFLVNERTKLDLDKVNQASKLKEAWSELKSYETKMYFHYYGTIATSFVVGIIIGVKSQSKL